MSSSYSSSDSSSSSEAKAFLNWVKALGESNEDLQPKIGLDSSRPVLEIDDLCDGVALLDVLATMSVPFGNESETEDGMVDNRVDFDVIETYQVLNLQ